MSESGLEEINADEAAERIKVRVNTRTESHLVLFDLETAGLDPKRHPIIQIAAIAVDENLSPVEAFEGEDSL